MNSASWQNSDRLISMLKAQYNINCNNKPGMTAEQAICFGQTRNERGPPNGRTAWKSDDDDDNDCGDDVDGGGSGGYVITQFYICDIQVLENNILHPCSRDNLEQLENKVLNGWDVVQINQFGILVS